MQVARYFPRFRKAYRGIAVLAQRECWTRGEIEAFQLDRINQVWSHAVDHVPYYQTLWAESDLPPRFDSLDEYQQRVPVLQKSAIAARPEAFLSRRATFGHWTRTGGSTGAPLKCYWSQAAHREMLWAKYRFLEMWGIDVFDRTAYVWGDSRSFASGLAGKIARLRQPLEDYLRNRIRLSSYRLGHRDLLEYLDRIAAFRPASLYGYASALDLLGQEAESSGFESDGCRLVTLTGEHVLPHVVQRLERVFSAPAVVEYGSIEAGTVASEGPDRQLRVREDMVFVETLPRDDGRFEIVISVLNNPSFPLLRYAISDVTDGPLTRPDVGFSILGNVAGRSNDLVVSRSGQYLHCSRFDAFFKYECTGVRRFRIRQRLDGSLHVAVELHNPTAPFSATELESMLRNLVEGHAVKVDVVASIAQTASGKYRFVISELTAPPARRATAFATNQTGAEPAAATDSTPEQAVRPAIRAGTNDSVANGNPPRATKAARLRQLLQRPQLDFAMEAHNGLSAKIVEEAGFEAVWASGLSISAALGVRDSNEASWTQVLETLEFMSDSTRIPILVDGDTGYGNFNNMRRLVRKLEQRHVAGVCIEDKLFPKTNSFIRGSAQPLAEIDEFCGRVQAGKDSQQSDEFVIVARTEAFIAGWGLDEALKRAEAYRRAGADAILIHSAQPTADEVIAFKRAWGDRTPVVIVPTKYYATPTEVFREHGFSLAIWANHLLRSSITAMQRTAQQLFEDQTLVGVEERVAPLKEVFRLQRTTELAEAEKRYLPQNSNVSRSSPFVAPSPTGVEGGISQASNSVGVGTP